MLFRSGELRFVGLTRDGEMLPGVQSVTQNSRVDALGIQSWEALLDYWRQHAEALGAAFAAGVAEVQPRQVPQSCRYCGMQSLCRVAERAGWDGLAPEEGDELGGERGGDNGGDRGGEYGD